MSFAYPLLLVVVASSTTLAAAEADGPRHRALSAVPFTAVKVQDAFWAPRLETNRKVTVPHNLKELEKQKALAVFDIAAGKSDEKHAGWADGGHAQFGITRCLADVVNGLDGVLSPQVRRGHDSHVVIEDVQADGLIGRALDDQHVVAGIL